VGTKFRGVSKRSNGYQLSFQFKGKRCREMLELPQTSKGEREANDILCAVRLAITRRTFEFNNYFPNSKKGREQNKNATTVEFELNEWMRLSEKSLAFSTQLDYRSRIRKHLIPVFGKLLFSELTRNHIYNFINEANLS